MSKAILIIISNIIPLIGVIFWGWNLANVILLYWTENIVLGIWTFAKILPSQGQKQANSMARKLFISSFFTIHYGIFCIGHLAFILSVLAFSNSSGGLFPFELMLNQGLINKGVLTGTAIMFITYGIDFFTSYLHSEERKQDPPVIMGSPYGHIIIIHIAIILSAILVMFTGEALGLLILIILGKIALEYGTLRRRQRKASNSTNNIKRQNL